MNPATTHRFGIGTARPAVRKLFGTCASTHHPRFIPTFPPTLKFTFSPKFLPTFLPTFLPALILTFLPTLKLIPTLILTLFLTFNLCAQPYKYLVLKGGGIRGIAYTGAIKVLEEEKISPGIEKVAGTSVGAIVGTLFSVGYSARELEDLMLDLHIGIFNDGAWSVIGGQKRTRRNYGWYKGKKLENWVGRQIKQQTGDENTTFLQLHQLAQTNKKFRDIYITATNLTTQKLEIFSYETFPDLPVKTAVRASVAIPLYFGAVFIDTAGKVPDYIDPDLPYNVYVDGGLLANYPIYLFNNKADTSENTINNATLGLKLERPEQIEYRREHKGIAPYNIHSFRSYIAALYNIGIEQLNKPIPYSEEKKHTIYISNGNLSPRVRHITEKQKRLLFQNGEEAARDFLKKKN